MSVLSLLFLSSTAAAGDCIAAIPTGTGREAVTYLLTADGPGGMEQRLNLAPRLRVGDGSRSGYISGDLDLLNQALSGDPLLPISGLYLRQAGARWDRSDGDVWRSVSAGVHEAGSIWGPRGPFGRADLGSPVLGIRAAVDNTASPLSVDGALYADRVLQDGWSTWEDNAYRVGGSASFAANGRHSGAAGLHGQVRWEGGQRVWVAAPSLRARSSWLYAGDINLSLHPIARWADDAVAMGATAKFWLDFREEALLVPGNFDITLDAGAASGDSTSTSAFAYHPDADVGYVLFSQAPFTEAAYLQPRLTWEHGIYDPPEKVGKSIVRREQIVAVRADLAATLAWQLPAQEEIGTELSGALRLIMHPIPLRGTLYLEGWLLAGAGLLLETQQQRGIAQTGVSLKRVH